MHGHKNIQNTLIYTQRVNFKTDEYEAQIAETVEEAKKRARFEYVNTIDTQHLYRRRK